VERIPPLQAGHRRRLLLDERRVGANVLDEPGNPRHVDVPLDTAGQQNMATYHATGELGQYLRSERGRRVFVPPGAGRHDERLPVVSAKLRVRKLIDSEHGWVADD